MYTNNAPFYFSESSPDYQPTLSKFGIFSAPVNSSPISSSPYFYPQSFLSFRDATSELRPTPTYSNGFGRDAHHQYFTSGDQMTFRPLRTETFYPGYLMGPGFLETPHSDPDMVYIYSKYKPLVSYKSTVPPARSAIEEVLYYFKELIYHDKEIEKIKENLANQGDFRISELFEFIDGNQTGQIVLGELKLVLMKSFDFVPREEDLYLLIRRVSRDGNDKLNFEEFKGLFLPRSRNYPAHILDNPRTANRDISMDTKLYITRLFRAYLNTENGLEYIRKIIAQKRVNLEAIFNKIDISGRAELLTSEELLKFLNYFEIYPNSSDMEGVMLRFDRNKTNKLSKGEFIYEFQPKLS